MILKKSTPPDEHDHVAMLPFIMNQPELISFRMIAHVHT